MAWIAIKRFLTNPTPWLLAGLLGFAVYQYMRVDGLAAERDAAQESFQSERQRSQALGTALDWQRDRIQVISKSLAERDDRLASIERDMAAQRQSLETLERNDEATRVWSDEPVPDAVRGWVRQLSTETGASAADEHSADASSEAAASTDGSG